MRNQKILTAALATVAGLSLYSAASAQTAATATADLNIRSGPGPQHEVIGVVNSGGEVTVSGCLRAANGARSAQAGAMAGSTPTI
jgi:uncharacterized protein YraI